MCIKTEYVLRTFRARLYDEEKTNVCRVNRARHIPDLSDSNHCGYFLSNTRPVRFQREKKIGYTAKPGEVSLLMNAEKSFSLRESGRLPFFSTS